jgi:hypothetical protein
MHNSEAGKHTAVPNLRFCQTVHSRESMPWKTYITCLPNYGTSINIFYYVIGGVRQKSKEVQFPNHKL